MAKHPLLHSGKARAAQPEEVSFAGGARGPAASLPSCVIFRKRLLRESMLGSSRHLFSPALTQSLCLTVCVLCVCVCPPKPPGRLGELAPSTDPPSGLSPKQPLLRAPLPAACSLPKATPGQLPGHVGDCTTATSTHHPGDRHPGCWRKEPADSSRTCERPAQHPPGNESPGREQPSSAGPPGCV